MKERGIKPSPHHLGFFLAVVLLCRKILLHTIQAAISPLPIPYYRLSRISTEAIGLPHSSLLTDLVQIRVGSCLWSYNRLLLVLRGLGLSLYSIQDLRVAKKPGMSSLKRRGSTPESQPTAKIARPETTESRLDQVNTAIYHFYPT